jgi:hypothetical protein
MRHRTRRRGAVPMLLSRRAVHDIAGPNLLPRLAPTLSPTASGGHEQDLTQWMGMPGRTGARLEGHGCAQQARRRGRLEEGIDADPAGEPVRRTFQRGLRAAAFDFQCLSP